MFGFWMKCHMTCPRLEKANNRPAVTKTGASTSKSIDACWAEVIAWQFKSATDFDVVWEGFLPSDHPDIIARSVSPVVYATKKQLYFGICDSPILIDGGKMTSAVSDDYVEFMTWLCENQKQMPDLRRIERMGGRKLNWESYSVTREMMIMTRCD
ncbi:hypothetical protein RJ639_002961 [Escallonia herrerae]|uniref:Uncharacterized protein n=1 Tax=Escallonia herrerae TaxID=1293975 RepID=A0AA88W4F6_9ASTE|nr:hypothetical protein RJ639_002961 [Escallonia herrerae]